jgi:hypothetical protein
MQEREITSRIRRDELQGLIEASAEPATTKRTTAPMPAVTLEQLLQPEPPPPPPPTTVKVTFRRPPRATDNPRPGTLKGTGPTTSVANVVEDEASHDDDANAEGRDTRETLRLTVRDTVRTAAAEAAGLAPCINGIPVQVEGVNSSMIATPVPTPRRRAPSAALDAAIDAAIDTEIHNAEIDAAIDAVVLPSLAMMTRKQHYSIVALSFALSFAAGIIIMFMLG